MAEEPKVFTKSQLVEKLTEVAKKQKEKNDIVIREKDEKITQLNNELTNLTESLNQFKNTQEQILNNVNALTDMNKQLSEENAKLKEQISELESKQAEIAVDASDTNMYQDFYEAVKDLISKYAVETNMTTAPVSEEITEQKKQRKLRQKKNVEEISTAIEESSAAENEVVSNQVKDEVVISTQEANIEVNSSDEDSIDVDALLSEL